MIAPEALDAKTLADCEVVVLANVGALQAVQVEALRAFVRGGGGLLLSGGDRMDPLRVNAQLGDLLPRPLRGVRRLTQGDTPDAQLEATHLDRVDYQHRVFQPFALPGGDSLQAANVFSYLLVEPQAGSSARLLASYGDGGPALLDAPYGAGRVALWTTSVDRDWSDFAISKAYLPLMRGLVVHLAGRSDGAGASAVVGQPFAIDVPDGATRIAVRGPLGSLAEARQSWAATELVGLPRVPFRAPAVGFYQVEIEQAGVWRSDPSRTFAAKLAPTESDLRRLDPDALAAFWAQPPAASDAEPGAEQRQGLWPLLLLVAMLFLDLETLVGLRRSFWAGLRRVTRAARRPGEPSATGAR